MDAELRYTQLGFEVIASIDRGISVKRKYGVEENGLCLLAAYCFEGLQRAKGS